MRAAGFFALELAPYYTFSEIKNAGYSKDDLKPHGIVSKNFRFRMIVALFC